mmetsp:Transcript_6747/g.9818  ORF Transcript_6747/g.9818 Transcript_6747/m.9818 type:complete len:92 (+) Transcript_6747:533-808(+)
MFVVLCLSAPSKILFFVTAVVRDLIGRVTCSQRVLKHRSVSPREAMACCGTGMPVAGCMLFVLLYANQTPFHVLSFPHFALSLCDGTTIRS